MAQRRELFRIAIDRTGHIHRGAEMIPCHVMNLTDKGIGLRVEGAFVTGDNLHLQFALSEADALACTVQVTYVQPPFLGGAITHISAHNQRKLSRFIDEVHTLPMTGF